MGAGVPIMLGLAGLGALFLLGDKKGDRKETPLSPQDGGLMLGQRSDGTIVIRTEARAWVLASLTGKSYGAASPSSGMVMSVALNDAAPPSPLQSAQAWANLQVASGRSVAISYEGAPRMASFPPSTASSVCREGSGLALLLEALPTPPGGGQPATPPAAPSPGGGFMPGGGGYSPPAGQEPLYPPGDVPMGGGGSPPAPGGGGGGVPVPGFPGLEVPPGWIPPGFPGVPTPPSSPSAPAPSAPAPSSPSAPAFPGIPPGFPEIPGMPGGGGGGAPSVPAAPRTYTIRSGDTGMKLAQRGTGSVYRWREIGAANPQLRPVTVTGQTTTDGSSTHAGYLPWYAGQTVITIPDGWGPL